VVALSATFGIGLLAGLNLPRTAGEGVAAVAPAAAVAVTRISADAQSAASNQAFRQGERADLLAAGSAASAASNQAFRQGERADLLAAGSAASAASNQAFRQGERADLLAAGSTASFSADQTFRAYQLYRQGERDKLGG
jgi:hypothetical protein